MKWPNALTFIRHGQSSYNLLKKKKEEGASYHVFKERFEKEFKNATHEDWASEELKYLARQVWQDTKLGVSDYNTPLTEEGVRQAEETGRRLKEEAVIPEVVYVSPYLRTRQTLEGLMRGLPELKKASVVSEERIREQEHGLATIYNDWRVYFVFNPVQALHFNLETDYEYRFLNGENKADVRDRVRSFLGTLIREHAGGKVLIISHHLTLLSLRANLERWDREKFIEVDKNDKPVNCGVTTYRGDIAQGRDGRLLLETYNQKLYN